MSPQQFSATLATLGWSQRHLALLLECDTNLPTRWATGRVAVPPSIARWLTVLAAFVEKHPAPNNWRVK